MKRTPEKGRRFRALPTEGSRRQSCASNASACRLTLRRSPPSSARAQTFMKQNSTTSKATLGALREAALAQPDVEVSVACAGTSVESASFKVRGKAFLFLRNVSAMVKLSVSRAEAERWAQQSPGVCKIGSGGWATITLATLDSAGVQRVRNWIAESYEQFASERSAAPTKLAKKPRSITKRNKS